MRIPTYRFAATNQLIHPGRAGDAASAPACLVVLALPYRFAAPNQLIHPVGLYIGIGGCPNLKHTIL
jgi:hypothetical protein